MVLHYSISFEGDPFTYHGEVDYPLNIYKKTGRSVESMTAFVKWDLLDSMRKWGFTPDQIVRAQFYFFRMTEEIIFFDWEKEDVTELHSTITQ